MDELNRLATQKVGTTSTDRSLVGERIGTYEIIEQIGRGGMGAVYRARDKSLDREVAVKILLPSLASDPEFEKRFVREARAAAKLDHPNVVQTYYAGRFENTLFIAMQLIKGRTLQDVLKDRRTFDPLEALRIIRQAADALQAAHRDGLVHRDIKPNNIMIEDGGRVKVMDFGLMRSTASTESITQSGIFFGTPEYASPEQCETKNVDGRTDIYSLGTVLYEMLTGRIPHVAETPLALFKKITDEQPSRVREMNPKISKDVERIVERMMAKKRDDRYPSCVELMADIDAVLGGATRAVEPARRVTSKGAIAAIAAAAIIGIACIVAFSIASKPAAQGGGSAMVPIANPTVLVFDFKNGTNEADTAWYEIALSDMMIAGLGQRGAKVPTRDQLLWKVQDLRLGDRITNANQRKLLETMAADCYLSGTYYVRAQKLRVTLTCYRASTGLPIVGPLTFEKLESEVFTLVDDMVTAVRSGLERALVAPAGAAPASAKLGVQPKQEVALVHPDEKRKEDKTPPRAREAAADSAPQHGGLAAPASPSFRPAEYLKSMNNQRNLSPLGSVERAKHWYANQQLAEQCGAEEEDVKLLLADLTSQFQASEEDVEQLRKGLENFRKCVNEASQARRQGVRRLAQIIDYYCPGCTGVEQKSPGACTKCEAPLLMRVQVQQAQEPKK